MRLTPELRQSILQFMAREGYQQKDLAEQLGVSAMTVSRWLRGEVDRIRSHHAKRLEEMIGEPEASEPEGGGEPAREGDLAHFAEHVGRHFNQLSPARQAEIMRILLEEN